MPLTGGGEIAAWADPYVWKVALAFGAGGLIGFLGLPASYLALALLDSSLAILGAALGLVSLAIPLLCFFVGGAVGGRSLRIGRRATLAFGFAFLLGGPVPLVSMFLFQASSGNAADVLAFALVCALAFGLIGGLGAALAGLGPPRLVAITVAFAASGAVCGGLFLLFLLHSATTAGSVATIPLLAAAALVFVVPMMIGGGVTAKLAKETLTKDD